MREHFYIVFFISKLIKKLFFFRPGIEGQKGAPGEYGDDGVCICIFLYEYIY